MIACGLGEFIVQPCTKALNPNLVLVYYEEKGLIDFKLKHFFFLVCLLLKGNGCNFSDVLTLSNSKEPKVCMQGMQFFHSMNSI